MNKKILAYAGATIGGVCIGLALAKVMKGWCLK